jgi:hypothetical protein
MKERREWQMEGGREEVKKERFNFGFIIYESKRNEKSVAHENR